MTFSRRDFLQKSAAAGAASILPADTCVREFLGLQDRDQGPDKTPKLKILILGGTKFVGPALVAAAAARGHTVTLFNRGRTNPHLFPELEKLKGDRNNDLKSLKSRVFDAVIDTSAYLPNQAELSAAALKDSSFYLFISSISVYPDLDIDTNIKTPVHRLKNPEAYDFEKLTMGDVKNNTYGPFKALCEEAIEEAMPGRVAKVRPGYIVGRKDPSDRFTYWPARVAKGGRVVVPGTPDLTIQYIDVRDLAEWCIALCEKKKAGTFNALGPNKPTAMGEFLKTCKSVSKSDATFEWVAEDKLKNLKVSLGRSFPIWSGKGKGLDRAAICDNSHAVAAGLKFRSLEDTVADTLRFHKGRGASYRMRTGLSPKKEKAIFEALDAARQKKSQNKEKSGAN
ncbi:MAG: twin-arginine translocation signal domain-containing protein [Planctomycetota bacterium]